jgi:hypothetical protein
METDPSADNRTTLTWNCSHENGSRKTIQIRMEIFRETYQPRLLNHISMEPLDGNDRDDDKLNHIFA